MTEQPTRTIRRRLLFILAGLVVCLCIALLFTYWYVPRSESKARNFQAYAPQKLPAGVHITSHSTTLRYGGILKYVAFDTNLTGFHISEHKMSKRDYTGTFGSCNFNRGPDTCVSLQTPGHTAYHVMTVEDSTGTPSLQSVYWYWNGTELEFNLQDTQAHHYVPASWGPVIDSFTPVNYGFEAGTVVNGSSG